MDKTYTEDEIYSFFYPACEEDYNHPELLLEKIEEVIEKTNLNIGKMKFQDKEDHPISAACANGWLHIVKYFYNSADSQQVQEYNQMNHNLIISVLNEEKEVIDYLLDQNINLEGTLGGQSALDAAFSIKDYEVAQKLIMQGLPIHYNEHSVLKTALENFDRENLKFILKCYSSQEIEDLQKENKHLKKYLHLRKMNLMLDGFLQINQNIQERKKMLN